MSSVEGFSIDTRHSTRRASSWIPFSLVRSLSLFVRYFRALFFWHANFHLQERCELLA